MLKKCIILILLVQTSLCFSQKNSKKIDSLFKLINETKSDTIKAINYLHLTTLTMYSNPTKTLLYLNKADSLYKKNNNNVGVAKLYSQKASYFYRLGKIDSARHYLVNSVDKFLFLGDTLKGTIIRHNIGILDRYQGDNESALNIMETNIPIFKKYNDSVNLANTFVIKGSISLNNGYSNIALKETYNALKIHRSLNDSLRIAEDLLHIGIINQAIKDHPKAIKNFKESIAYYKKSNNQQSIAQALNFMAYSKIKQANFDSAEENLTSALKISEQLNYAANIARTYYNFGLLEYNKENYSNAINYYTNSLEKFKAIGIPDYEGEANLQIGKSYLALKKFNLASKYLDKAITIGQNINDLELYGDGYFQKSLSLEAINNHKDALEYLRKTKTINDSLFTIERTKASLELTTIYETEKKEREILVQENEITVLEQKAKVSNLQKLLLGGGLSLSLITLGFGFYGFREKIKRNKVEKEKLDNDLAFKKKELTTHALHLAKKNEVLESLKSKAETLKTSENSKHGFQQLIRDINFDLQDDKNWDNFSRYFEEVHQGFSTKAQQQFPNITANDLRLMSLLKMNLTSKEIANILNISSEGIKKARYRLRKKLNLSTEDSLENFILAFA